MRLNPFLTSRRLGLAAGALLLAAPVIAALGNGTADPHVYHEGDLAGSLKSSAPLPLYDPDPKHLWNRLFTALYTRPSDLPSQKGAPAVKRIEGGDVLEFLGWAKTTYWDQPEVVASVEPLLDDLLKSSAEKLPADPLMRVHFQHDLWAAHDFLIGRTIARAGTAEERTRRTRLTRKLAQAIRKLALPASALEQLPDNYALAVQSGAFKAEHNFDPAVDYLPAGVLTRPEEWIELDFFRPDLHEDIDGRFLTLHARHFRGRSYFRVFYRYPGGRKAYSEYARYIENEGIDWKFGAQNGFLRLKPGLNQIPAGTEVALIQQLIALDDQLRPVPTRLVQSVRVRTFKNTDGSADLATHSSKGMNVYEYVLRRRLLFAGPKQGGLEREPNDLPQYRLVFQGANSPDWGPVGRTETVARQCVTCHSGQGQGVYTLVTLINQGGFDAGAMMGVAHPIDPAKPSPHAARVARWKSRDESYRRLLESLE